MAKFVTKQQIALYVQVNNGSELDEAIDTLQQHGLTVTTVSGSLSTSVTPTTT